MAVQLTATQTLIRYISEWDPRELAHTKGGYIEGVISVPDLPGTIRMEVSTYPALDAEPFISTVHPILLHLVRIGKTRREQEFEPVPTFTHWRQNFEIEADGKVFILNQRSQLDVDKDGQPRQVPARAHVATLRKDRTILMSKRRGDLNLIPLQPKQRSRCRETDGEATITKVLMDRLGISGVESETTILPYEKLFQGRNAKNKKRMRIKVDFIQDEHHSYSISSETIIDTGNKDIGAMDFVDAHPLSSCSRGGRTVMMLSEYNLSREIGPVFLIYTLDPDTGKEEEREDLEHLLVQPSDIEVRNTQVIFKTPAQTRLAELPWPHTLKLAVRRFGDGNLSGQRFDWSFREHLDGSCLECDWGVDELSEESSGGIEAALLQNMVREAKGWSCRVCGHDSTSTAAKSDIKKHVWNKHMRD